MRVCLIIPPSMFLLDERVFPSLGALKVASALLDRGWPVEVLDLSGISNYEDVVRIHAESTDARYFGLTATTPQLPAATRIASVLGHVRPDARLILGGPHPTLVNAARKNEWKRDTRGRAHHAFDRLKVNFHTLVAGDGERAIFEAVEKNEKNLVDRALVDADIPKSPFFLSNGDLDELPWPARHLIDFGSYHYDIDGHDATSLIAQLGCPFQCGFCGGRSSPMLRRVRTRSIENIVDEIEMLWVCYDKTGFMFYDDELNVNRKMVGLMDGIADVQARLGVEFGLRGFVKSELFTDEQAIAMRKAGFRQILVGFESGSSRILTNIDKRATRDDNTRCMEIAKRHGLKVKALMSIGHPGESPETIEETKDWLLGVEPEDFDCTIITTYPGTPYYDDAVHWANDTWTYTHKRTGDRLHMIDVDYGKTADYYKGDPDGGYKSYVYTDLISSHGLVDARDALEWEVREKLGIPFNPAAPAVNYEHSMGQGGLSRNILRVSGGA